jgi:hypothetical protein
VTRGSYGGHWVGEVVIAIDSGRTLRIAAIQPNGRYVLTDGANNYVNIGADDIATTRP